MKLPLITLLTSFIVATPLFGSPEQMRKNIDAEMPLDEAIAEFNSGCPDPSPLTESEVVASIRNMKSEHPDLSDAMYELYQSVVERRMLPKGMYFKRMTSLTDDEYSYKVQWMDLAWTNIPHTEKHPNLGWGFNHRIRGRFVSSRELTNEEKENQDRLTKQLKKLRVEQAGDGNPIPPRVD